MNSDERTTGLQTWSSSGRVVLTVTPEGRVVPGEGMQMDAVAREFLAACDVYGASREAENARLRERVSALEAACYEEEVEGGPRSFSGFFCRLCGWDCSPDFKAEHEPSCVLYEADAALAQADETGGAR